MPSRKTKLRALFLLTFSLGIASIVPRALVPMVQGRPEYKAQVPVRVGSRDQANALPDAEGKELVLAACAQCHTLSTVALQRKSAEKWEDTLRDMIARGAQVRPEEGGTITGYLARSFGPDAPQPEVAGQKQTHADLAAVSRGLDNSAASLPEGPGKAAIVTSCTECHGLKEITEQRKERSGWQATVKDMVRLGAKLRSEEISAIVAYLVTNFGAQRSKEGRAAGPDSPAGNARFAKSGDLSIMLPDGEGKGLILASCVQCHGLQEVVGQRKHAEGWKRTVHDMVSRGAQLTWSEAEIIASYLGQSMSK